MAASAPTPSILVVDDDEGLLILMAEALRDAGYAVATAESGATALARLKSLRPDLMLLDLKLQDVGGAALVKQLRRADHAVPFIVVTGQGDEKVAVEIMKEGALDYVMKDSALLDLLPTVVKRALTTVGHEHALAEAERTRQRLEREILEVGEREQHRIGEDLHDSLGQQLTAIEMLCTSLKADIAASQPSLLPQVDRIAGMLREAVAQTRSMARGLVPVKDEPEALWVSLVELAERTDALGRTRCVFHCPQPVLVEDNAVAGHLYRIAQEAVNNALKHGGARHVTLSLAESDGTIELTIADDGHGLAKTKGAGMGLQVMKHRAEMIHGELTVDSKSGRGVTITCRVPAAPKGATA